MENETKVALVTGASRGIGRACAIKLAECGYDVAVNYNSNEAKAREVVSAIEETGRRAIAVKADTADLKAVQNMFREVHKAFGRLDVLVNNAGVVDDAYLLMINEDSLSRSLDINIKGYFHCAQQAALKMMSKKQGKIINISSVSSVLAVEGQGVYSATKGAVNSMTATLAKELAPRGITVNAVAPGFIETEMIDAIPGDKKEEYLKAVPMHKFGTAADVANVVAQLCSEAFAYMTGQVIVLDGGLSL
ncbi:MAG: 3-oxoacyl-ACP reductase family protein [Oscillospiraceae bacterium]